MDRLISVRRGHGSETLFIRMDFSPFLRCNPFFGLLRLPPPFWLAQSGPIGGRDKSHTPPNSAQCATGCWLCCWVMRLACSRIMNSWCEGWLVCQRIRSTVFHHQCVTRLLSCSKITQHVNKSSLKHHFWIVIFDSALWSGLCCKLIHDQ